MKLTTTVLHARWQTPLASAHGDGSAPRPLVLVALETADGIVGHGEAAPLEAYDGVSLDAVCAALAACAPALRTADGDDHAATLAACRACTSLPQALAAIDLALWDIAGRQLGRPVWELLGASPPPQVAVNAVIGAESTVTAVREATAAVARGYRCLKLKVGVGDDRARVRAVREAVGPRVALRLDANGAWGTPAVAIAALNELAELGIEMCEEPVHGAERIGAVSAAVPIAVAADESSNDPALYTARRADAICLKIASAGGVSGVLADAGRARALGYAIYLASTLDGPLGIAGALHAAVALRPDRPCGLSTLERFVGPPTLTVTGGWMSPLPGPGLGDGLLEWYAALAG